MGLLDWFNFGGSLLGGVLDNFGADMRAKKDREWNSAEAEKNREFQTSEREAAQEWNLEQWNRENEYNSPKEQMRRAIEAGMNPNVAMQGIAGSSNAGQLTTSGQSGVAAGGKMNGTMSNFGGSVNSFWSAMLAKEQIEDLQQTRPEREDDLAAGALDKRESANVRKEEAENLKQERKNLVKIGEKIDVEKDQLQYALDRAKRFEDAELEAIRAQADKYREEIENLKKQRDLIGEQIETEESQQTANYAAANNSNAQASNANKQGEILDRELTVATVKATLANDLGITNCTDADAAIMIAYAQGKITQEEFDKWLDGRRQKRNADEMASNPYEMVDKGIGSATSGSENKPLKKIGNVANESIQYGVGGFHM